MKFILLFLLSTSYILHATPLFDRCGICHGAKGERHSLNLTKPIAGMNANEVVEVLEAYKAGKKNTYGFGNMMKGQTSKLSSSDMKEIASYVESLPKVEIANEKTPKKEPSAAMMFKKCSICHGKKGEKKSLGVSKTIAGMKASEIIEELEDYKIGKKDLYGYGNMMRGQTTKLSHENIIKIAKYIESLPPVIPEKEKMREPNRKITQEELDYNTFMDEYFKNSKNPNETFEAAKKSYEKHKKN